MVDDASDADDARGVAAWSRLMHIGAHEGDTSTRPNLAELGIDEVHRVCVRAWKYSRNDFEPNMWVQLKRSQWRETCALAGSMAESLMLGSAAYVEAVWHQRAISADAEPAGMALAQRYLADGAIADAVSVGHRLANFVVRVARTSVAARTTIDGVRRLRPLGSAYIPFATNEPDAWLSLNEPTVTCLRQVLDSKLHQASVDALDQLATSPEWIVAVGNRAENFHRWRKEHEYVTGVDAESGAARDLYDAANQHIGRTVGGHGRRHRLSDGLTARTTDAAGKGLRRVAETLDIVLTNTVNVVLPIQHDGFTVRIDDPNRIGTQRI